MQIGNDVIGKQSAKLHKHFFLELLKCVIVSCCFIHLTYEVFEKLSVKYLVDFSDVLLEIINWELYYVLMVLKKI